MPDIADLLHAQLDELGAPGHAIEDSAMDRVDLLAGERDRYRAAIQWLLDAHDWPYHQAAIAEARRVLTAALNPTEAEEA